MFKSNAGHFYILWRTLICTNTVRDFISPVYIQKMLLIHIYIYICVCALVYLYTHLNNYYIFNREWEMYGSFGWFYISTGSNSWGDRLREVWDIWTNLYLHIKSAFTNQSQKESRKRLCPALHHCMLSKHPNICLFIELCMQNCGVEWSDKTRPDLLVLPGHSKLKVPHPWMNEWIRWKVQHYNHGKN